MKRLKHKVCLLVVVCIFLQILCHTNASTTDGMLFLPEKRICGQVEVSYKTKVPFANEQAYRNEQEQAEQLLGYMKYSRNRKVKLCDVVLFAKPSHSFYSKGYLVASQIYGSFQTEHLINHVIINYVHHKDGSKGTTLL